MKVEKISELTTNRLSVYLRCLNELAAQGAKSISSDGLAKKFQLNSAQIRKDLAYFGEFGVRGVGYYIDDLRAQLTKILGLDKQHSVAIIGAGRLGTALADYYAYAQTNFTVSAMLDADPRKIGLSVGGVEIFEIMKLREIVDKHHIDVAVIAVPAEQAREVLDLILDSGIKAVMNFAPVPLRAKGDVKIKNVDLTISLESLSYFLAKANGKGAKNLKPNGSSVRIKSRERKSDS